LNLLLINIFNIFKPIQVVMLTLLAFFIIIMLKDFVKMLVLMLEIS